MAVEMTPANNPGDGSAVNAGVILELSVNRDLESQALPNYKDYTPPAELSWEDFKAYFWHKGNLRTLMVTSLCWFCVDLPFCGLGMSSPTIITAIWDGQNYQPGQVYDFLVANVWQSLIIVSLGGIVGSLITFIAIDKLGRRIIQITGFFCLFFLFIIIGASFKRLASIGGSPATIVLYILAQIFYNFGKFQVATSGV
jgi:MFS transporter, PHS family, inorganic phosphate transporter